MATEMLSVLRYIRRLACTSEFDEQTDDQLLEQFVAKREEGAFAALMRRHGPLVLGACRHLLEDTHEAEDAFQATFLVLARKAGSIRRQEALAGWLYRVALNISRTARSTVERRKSLEKQAVIMLQQGSKASEKGVDEVSMRDLQALIHEEVDLLEEKYRVPIVLCYLEGKSHDEAAQQLGWPLGTVKGRLARAREALRGRLARRGITLSAGAIATALTQAAAAGEVPAVLLCHTLKAAVCFATGASIPAGAVSGHALTLAKGALQVMTTAKSVSLLVLIMSVALLVTISVVAGMPEVRKEARAINPLQPDQPRAEAPVDPLPDGVVARMGTPRFRHGGPVSSMVYLQDGKILATGGPIGTRRQTGMGRIRLWDTVTGKELRQFHLKGNAHVAGSPDGKILAGADQSDGIIYLWDAATGKEIRKLKGSTGPQAVAFSGDGKKLATGGHKVRIWEVETGKLLHTAEHDESAIALAFSADSKILAVKYIDLSPFRLYQVDPWKTIATLGPKGTVDRFALSPDNRTVAVTSRPAGGYTLEPEVLRERGVISLHDAKDVGVFVGGDTVRHFQAHKFLDPRGQEHITSLVFSPDGKTLASAGSDKAIRLWDVATTKELQAFPADSFSIGSVAFAPDGKSLAWANSSGTIRIWDLRTGKVSHGHDGHQGVVTSVALSLDSKILITAGADSTIRFWETASGKELRRFEGHEGPIATIHLSKDGKTLASVSPADKTVRVWEVSTGKELRRFRASTTFCDAAWLPDSRTLVIRRFDDPAVYFCDIATGEEVRKIEKTWTNIGISYPANVEGAHRGGVLEVSPDGKMLVTSIAYSGPSFHLWDTVTGKELPSLSPDHNKTVYFQCAVFSPDGKTLLKPRSQYESTIHVWDIAAREERQKFAGHFKVKGPEGEEIEVPTNLNFTHFALSPDGRTLATAAGDPTIRLWDIVSGKERRLEGHRGTVTSLAWSADGRTLVSGSNDGTAFVWKLAD